MCSFVGDFRFCGIFRFQIVRISDFLNISLWLIDLSDFVVVRICTACLDFLDFRYLGFGFAFVSVFSDFVIFV